MHLKRLALSVLLCSFLIAGSSSTLNMRKAAVRTIVIDPGHGGKDPGCIGYHKKSYEKDVALDIAVRLGKLIEKQMPGTKVVFTRSTDVFIPLWQRASIANKHQADLFVSIHCNASESSSLHGTETYVMGVHKTVQNLNVSKRENAAILHEEDYQVNEEYEGFDPSSDEGHIILSLYQNAYRMQSLELASNFQDNIETHKIRRNLGVKEAGFLVLWKTAMPSILVETGFLTNSDDQDYLLSENGKTKLAGSIFQAVYKYKNAIETDN